MHLIPLIVYPGGKRLEIKYFKHLIPKFSGRYIEPFAGGAAVFWYLNRKNSIINDFNTALINFYNSVKDISFSEKINKLFNEFNTLEIEKQKEMYYYIREVYNSKIIENHNYDLNLEHFKKYSEYHNNHLYFFLLCTCFNGLPRTNSKGYFNTSFGKIKQLKKFELYVTDEHIELLNSTEIYNLDYKEIFKLAKEDDFIFLDPPYDETITNYGNNIDFTREQQIELSKEFKKLKSKAMMVVKDTPLMRELYDGYIKHTYNKRYLINAKKDKLTHNHIVIMNY